MSPFFNRPSFDVEAKIAWDTAWTEINAAKRAAWEKYLTHISSAWMEHIGPDPHDATKRYATSGAAS